MTFPAEPESVRAARRAIAHLLDDELVAPERREAATLVVSEAVSNAVLHAYDVPGGVVELFAIRAGAELILVVSDRGRGLEHPPARPGLGVGLRLIRGSADQALIASAADGGTTVQCRFELSGRPRQAETGAA